MAVPTIAYTVRASLPSASERDRYTQWLVGGHIQAVVAGGALSASVVRVDEPPDLWVVEARYSFGSRAALDVYLRDHAPRLRAEGLAAFGPESGALFSREVGAILP